ncbi:MAG: hypothetical protein WA215_07000 [Candidatus Cybelea sp.]
MQSRASSTLWAINFIVCPSSALVGFGYKLDFADVDAVIVLYLDANFRRLDDPIARFYDGPQVPVRRDR